GMAGVCARWSAGKEWGNPPSLVHAPAARADIVLPARRRAAGDHHAAHLCRHHSVRADPAAAAAAAVFRAGPSNRPAWSVVWLLREHPMKASELFDISGRVALVT